MPKFEAKIFVFVPFSLFPGHLDVFSRSLQTKFYYILSAQFPRKFLSLSTDLLRSFIVPATLKSSDPTLPVVAFMKQEVVWTRRSKRLGRFIFRGFVAA